MKQIITSTLIFLLFSSAAAAETLYVTDRILLGIHQEAKETSPVIKTIPSGTAVTVEQQSDSFTKIKLADGTQGWVSKIYLIKQKPAVSEVDALAAQLKKYQQDIKKLSDDLVTKEREVQIHRDELSNAKSNIKELKKALKDAGNTTVPTEKSEELGKAEQTIKQLEEKIAELEKSRSDNTKQESNETVSDLQQLQNQNKEFQARIEAALANLKGETVPSAAELAAIRPSFPFWYWLLLIALLLAGAGAGVFTMDFLHRRKHGGFRL